MTSFPFISNSYSGLTSQGSGTYTSPVFVDIDGDGDLDAFVGLNDGSLIFFTNSGSSTAPSFATGTLPTGLSSTSGGSAPTFADLDNDGDFDAFVGDNFGNIQYFENTGNNTSPTFSSAVSSPFGLTDIGAYAAPTFVDIDGDGDLDAFVGSFANGIQFFENLDTGNANPNFAAPVSNYAGLNVTAFSTEVAFADIDGDGDFDAVVGNNYGTISYFLNTGSSTAPAFTEQSGTDSPFDDINVGGTPGSVGGNGYSAPTFADIDGDGDVDLLVGAQDGDINFFRNSSADINVSPISGLITTEANTGTATFTVTLTESPSAEVTIPITSGDTGEGTVSAGTLTFAANTTDLTQTVTITGVDDSTTDGNQTYTVTVGTATSSDTSYNGLDPSDIVVTNLDNTTGINVSPTFGVNTDESGATDTFTVVLNSVPTDTVTIALTNSDTTAGTLSASTLTFTTANATTPQTVTATGVNDDNIDGTQTYTISGTASSNDTNYQGLTTENTENVVIRNFDDDVAGVTVDPVSGLSTTEAGGTATFTVVLSSNPTADVTIGLTSSNTAEGTLSASTLTFTSANGTTPQTVTVTGVNDTNLDNNQDYTVTLAAASSTDTNYSGIDPNDVELTNIDNDAAGVTVIPTTGLTTTEAGGTATFTVVLNNAPAQDVTIALASSNTAEGTLSASTLTFTNANGTTAQTVTVTGIDDTAVDGDVAYSVTTGATVSTDTTYNGLTVDDVTVTNINDDVPTITVSPTTLTTTEGGTGTFTVVLSENPTQDVTIDVTSGDTTEGTLSASTLTFTSANGTTAQTVAVTGIDDTDVDDAQTYTITTGVSSSTDTNFNGINPSDIVVTNNDNETAGVTVTPTSGLTTTEAGGTATFTVALNTLPTQDVTIDVTSGDTTEGTLSASTLTFTSANGTTAQTVTVTGIDDTDTDGAVLYTITTGATVSTDPNYSGLTVDDVTATNTDNDVQGSVTVTPTTLTTTEAGGTATFTVALSANPTADVTIDVTSGDTTEGTLSASTLTFTSANGTTAQTVTVTGIDDNIDDGDVQYTITTGATVSSDTNFSGVTVNDVTVTNTDDDTAGITVTPTTLTTTEAGGTATFTVALDTLPTADVTIDVTSGDTTEGTLSASTLTFTNANGTTAQTVTVTGVDDTDTDGSVQYTVTTGNAVSSDTNYSGLTAADVTVTNTDDDPQVLTLTQDTTTNIFTIGGNAGETTTFTFDLSASNGAFVNEIFVVATDNASGTVNGVSPGASNYLSTAFANGQGTVILSPLANGEFADVFTFSRSIGFTAQQNLVFGLVQNSSVDTVLNGGTATVLYAQDNGTVTNFTDGSSSFTLSWEDSVSGSGDTDSNDVVVNITSTANSTTTGSTFQGNQQGELLDFTSLGTSVSTTVTIRSEAAFDNVIGFYRVDTSGNVLDEFGNTQAALGATDYTTAAINNRVTELDFTSSSSGSVTITDNLNDATGTGFIYAPFLISNGTTDTALSGASDVFFNYTNVGSNAGNDHIRLLGDNIFGFEDIVGGGDNDFNDIVVEFSSIS